MGAERAWRWSSDKPYLHRYVTDSSRKAGGRLTESLQPNTKTLRKRGLSLLACRLLIYGLLRVLPPRATLVRSTLICGLTFMLARVWPAAGFLVILEFAVVIPLIAAVFLLLGGFDCQERPLLWWLIHRRCQGRDATVETLGTDIASCAETNRD
jgi:hypothetical protein